MWNLFKAAIKQKSLADFNEIEACVAKKKKKQLW